MINSEPKKTYKFNLHDKLKTFAENYVTDVYAPVGQRVYYWEEWTDPEDDTTCEGVSDFAPPEEGSYCWSEVTQNTITGSSISESDENTGEYCVDVSALIAVYTGLQDEDTVEELEPDERTIYVHSQVNGEDDFYVEMVEE